MVRLDGGEVVRAITSQAAGTNVTLTLRPERVHLYRNREECPAGRNAIDGTVTRRIFQGETMFYEVEVGESGSIEVHVENLPGMARWDVGDNVVVDFHHEAARALTA